MLYTECAVYRGYIIFKPPLGVSVSLLDSFQIPYHDSWDEVRLNLVMFVP